MRSVIGSGSPPAAGIEKLLAMIDGAVCQDANRGSALAGIAHVQTPIEVSDTDPVFAERGFEMITDVASEAQDTGSRHEPGGQRPSGVRGDIAPQYHQH